MDHPKHVHPAYTSPVFSADFQKTVDKTINKLNQMKALHSFDAIAGTGLSSIPLIGAVSAITGIKMLLTRKPSDKTHDNHKANGYLGCERYVVIDDLIDSGATLKGVCSAINHQWCVEQESLREMCTMRCWEMPPHRDAPKMEAVLLYNAWGGNRRIQLYKDAPVVPVYQLEKTSLDMTHEQVIRYYSCTDSFGSPL